MTFIQIQNIFNFSDNSKGDSETLESGAQRQEMAGNKADESHMKRPESHMERPESHMERPESHVKRLGKGPESAMEEGSKPEELLSIANYTLKLADGKEDSTIQLDLKNNFILCFGFVDWCLDLSNVSDFAEIKSAVNRSVSLGFTRILLLVSFASTDFDFSLFDPLVVVPFFRNNDSFTNKIGDLVIIKKSDLLYELHKNNILIHEISPFSNGNQLYGSGNPNLCPTHSSFYSKIISKGPHQDFKQLLNYLALTRNLVQSQSSTAVFFKLPAQSVSVKDGQNLLSAFFMSFDVSTHTAQAVYSNSALVHSTDAWNRLVQQQTMAKYYSTRNDKLAVSSSTDSLNRHAFDTIPDAIAAFKRGEFLVVVDNEDRENEGDLVIAGQDLTPEKCAFMIRYTSGVICAPCSGEVLDKLQIPQMVAQNEDAYKTAYTVSIDASLDTTTGISSHDRSTTIKLLANPSSWSNPSLFTKPGHVFPLRAVNGGVLERLGHTEASIDLCKLAQKEPVSAISEIVKDQGGMMRRDELIEFARRHGILICCISDLVRYRLDHGI